MNNELVSWCLRHLQEQELWPWEAGWNPQIGDDPKEKDESHGERQLVNSLNWLALKGKDTEPRIYVSVTGP